MSWQFSSPRLIITDDSHGRKKCEPGSELDLIYAKMTACKTRAQCLPFYV